jgi:hypothetical protein
MSKKDKKVENGLVDTPVETVETAKPKQDIAAPKEVAIEEVTPGHSTRAFRG